MKNIAELWNRIYNGHPTLATWGAIHFMLFFLFLAIAQIDYRILMGINIWIKPMKFAASASIFCWTFALILPLYPYTKKQHLSLGNIAAWLLGLEVIIIGIQAARGELSHFNTASLSGNLIFALMGIAIGIVALIIAKMMVEAFKKPLQTSKAMSWSIRFAWIIVFMACLVGGLMSGMLKHSVGISDGGVGLPILNWSTKGGDLRVAHFFGLHALQILPLTTWTIGKLSFSKYAGLMVITSISLGIFYLSWVLFTFIQAIRGIPFVDFPYWI